MSEVFEICRDRRLIILAFSYLVKNAIEIRSAFRVGIWSFVLLIISKLDENVASSEC